MIFLKKQEGFFGTYHKGKITYVFCIKIKDSKIPQSKQNGSILEENMKYLNMTSD